MMRRFLAPLVLAMTGCGPVPYDGPQGTPGALRNGGFVFCDPAGHCGDSDPLPEGIAVGSMFALEFSDGVYGAELKSANDDRLELIEQDARERTETKFQALLAGPATVEARDGSELIDTITLTLASVASLRPEVCARSFNAIADPDVLFDPFECAGSNVTASGVTISRGASLAPTVCVVPLGASGTALSGLLSGTFTATGDAELELDVDAGGRCATIGALTLGDAKVTVATGDIHATFTVRVKP